MAQSIVYLNETTESNELISGLLAVEKFKNKLEKADLTEAAEEISAKHYFFGESRYAISIGTQEELMDTPLMSLIKIFSDAKESYALGMNERRKNPQTNEIKRPGAFR